MHNSKLAASLILTTGIWQQAFAQQPPDVVSSDQYSDTAMGTGALINLTPNSNNCFAPDYCGNTAAGFDALFKNTTGVYNTAVGAEALVANTSGRSNTAVGSQALQSNTTGVANVAVGIEAMFSNTKGTENTAIGLDTLGFNTTGNLNTATGTEALAYNTSGFANTGTGASAVDANTTGEYNTGTGYGAAYDNTIGNYNTADGVLSLQKNVDGSYNIALGASAGSEITGSNNIDIGNEGSKTDSGVIRIGTPGIHTGTAIAGIYGSSVTGGVEVVIDSKGKLGMKTSARRFKDDIQTMGDSSERLYQLQPVTFRYKDPEPDGGKPVQYELVAEDVAKVYPELVERNDKGQIMGVHYDELGPMLLNELKQQRHDLEELKKSNQAMRAVLDRLSAIAKP